MQETMNGVISQVEILHNAVFLFILSVFETARMMSTMISCSIAQSGQTQIMLFRQPPSRGGNPSSRIVTRVRGSMMNNKDNCVDRIINVLD